MVYSLHVACGRGSVILRRRCNVLRTSGFVSDVLFSHNGSYGTSGCKLKMIHQMAAGIQHRGLYSNWLTRGHHQTGGGVWCLELPCLCCTSAVGNAVRFQRVKFQFLRHVDPHWVTSIWRHSRRTCERPSCLYTVFHKIGTPLFFLNNFLKCWLIWIKITPMYSLGNLLSGCGLQLHIL